MSINLIFNLSNNAFPSMLIFEYTFFNVYFFCAREMRDISSWDKIGGYQTEKELWKIETKYNFFSPLLLLATSFSCFVLNFCAIIWIFIIQNAFDDDLLNIW